MAGKRKRSYYRSYSKRRRTASASSVAKQMSKIMRNHEGYGKPGSYTWERYGPSKRQMMDHPGTGRTAQQTQNRLIDNYRGPGGYWSDLGRNIGHWGSRVGGAALGALSGAEGGIAGTLLGAGTGWGAGADFSKAQGWGAYTHPTIGDYDVPRGANDLFQRVGGNGSAPIYHSAGAADETGDVIISNRELVKLVKSHHTPGQFKVESFTCNPVDSPTFHHLREQANQYENFEFTGLMFQYVPMTGEGGSNELGVVGMAASYDPAHTRTFTDMEHLMRFKGATTFKPSVGMVHGIECHPAKRAIKRMFVRDHITRDAQFTDPATFYIASEGCPNAEQTLGQLWVSYSVRLSNIKLVDEVEADVNYNLFGKANTLAAATATTTSHLITGPKFVNDFLGLAADAELTATSRTFIDKVVNKSDATDSILRVYFDKTKVQVGEKYMITCSAGFNSTTGNWVNETHLGMSDSGGASNDVEMLSSTDILYDVLPKFDNGVLEPSKALIEENFDGAGSDRLQQHVVIYLKITGVDDPYYEIKFRPVGGADSGAFTGLHATVRVAVSKLITMSTSV